MVACPVVMGLTGADADPPGARWGSGELQVASVVSRALWAQGPVVGQGVHEHPSGDVPESLSPLPAGALPTPCVLACCTLASPALFPALSSW